MKSKTRQSDLRRRNALFLSIALALALAPAASRAAEDEDEEEGDTQALKELTEIRSEVEIGMCYVSDDSVRFGRYNGLDDQGVDLLLNFDILRRLPYDSGDDAYFAMRGLNLGLDSRELGVEFGRQGKYKVHLDYDQIPALHGDDARTIYNGAGTDTLTLPSNWVGAQTTPGMTRLLPSLQGFDTGTERRRAGAGVEGQIARQWSFVTDFRRETKEGIKTLGATFGNSGGNPRAVLLPEPVDYTTDQIDAALRYTGKKFQFQAAYYASIFSDGTNGISFQNPYTTINGWTPPQAGFPTGRGEISTPPDNQFHQISVDGGYNFSESTRLSASFARGRMTQDETFLPYSALPQIQASITQPLPRNSLDGEIDTTVATVQLSSRPWERFFWNASYRYDDRDNDTPRDRYVYIGGDSQLQPTSASSDRIRFNEPYSYKDEQFKLEGGYRLFGSTELTLGGEHRETERTYSSRENTDENTFRAELRTGWADWISGSLRWTHANRNGSTYDGAEPLHSGYAPEYVATVPGPFENPPALRQFFLADRDRDMGSMFVTVTPIETLSLSGSIDYALDDYNESELGLTLSRIRDYTVNAVWAPDSEWSVYGFWTYEKIDTDQAGRSLGGSTRVADSVNVNRNWNAFHNDELETGGIGVKKTFPDRHADIGLDVVHSNSDAKIEFTTGSLLAARNLPTAKTQLDSISLYGSCQLRENLSLKLRYWYEKYDSSDWQLDGVVPNQLANVITLGEQSQDYKVHVVFASLVWRF